MGCNENMNFYGQGKDRSFYELSLLRVDPKFRDREPELIGKKWFDYRMMHPVEATYCLAHHYNQQAQKFYSICKDTDTAHYAIGINPEDAMRSPEVNAIWRARFTIDNIGCPYPWALQFLMERAIRIGFRTFPRPNQMYGVDSVVDLYNAWKEKLSTQLTFGQEEHLKASSWSEHPAQIAHIEFIKTQIDKRGGPKHRLVARLFKEGVLDDQLAARFFPSEATLAGSYFREMLNK